MQYVIIGNSAAGIFAAEAIAKNDPDGEITMVSKEGHRPYSRCLTTYLIAGDIKRDNIFIRSKESLAGLALESIYGAEVMAVKPKNKTIVLGNGKNLNYDRLLIASGGSPAVPDLPGGEAAGLFTLRTLDDAEGIMELAQPGKHAVILGGGLVSLKTAYALIKRGLKVTVLVSSPQILSQMLDATAAGLLQKRLGEHGVKFGLNLGAEKVLTGRDGGVRGVGLDNGDEMICDLILVGKGVRPNTGFLADTGVEIDWGIVVNDYLQTSVQDIYAAGDVAAATDLLLETKRVNATWPNATEQGRIAGMNMSGAGQKYAGSLALNSVEFFGLPAISVGLTRVNDAKYEVFEEYRPERNYYRKLIFQDKYLVGFTLVGDISFAGTLTALIRYRQDISGQKNRLIRQGRAVPGVLLTASIFS